MTKETASVIGLAGLVSACVAMSTMGHAAPKWAKSGDTIEKCAGIVKAGQNDCGANAHGCHAKAEKDNDPEEWVYMPAGICERLTGGVVKASKTIE